MIPKMTKAEFLKYPDTGKLLSLYDSQKIDKFESGYNLNTMCSTATARRDALVMLTDLSVDLIESYESVINSQNELADFMGARQAKAQSLISGAAEAYGALSEICARALLTTVNETPAYPTQISKMKNFCRLLGNIVAAHKVPNQMYGFGSKSPLYASVLLTNRRSMHALSQGGFTREGSAEDRMLETYRGVFDRDWIAVYTSKQEVCPTYFGLRDANNPIQFNVRDAYLGYNNIPNQKGENENTYEREMRGHVGAMNSSGSCCEDKTSGMFAFFPFEEQRADIVKNKLVFARGTDIEHNILCEARDYSPIFDTAHYRIFALAELCLVRILIRERGAMLNMVQYEIASDALRSLVNATVSANSLYSQQKAAEVNARIRAEMEAAAAKKAEQPAAIGAKKKAAAEMEAAAARNARITAEKEAAAAKPAAKKVTVKKVRVTAPKGVGTKKK